MDLAPVALGADIAACDRDPIHIPGSIQPHGLLLVADGTTFVVVGGAGALEDRLDPDWLGRTLSDLTGQDVPAQLAASPDSTTVALGDVVARRETLVALAHRIGPNVVVELEPVAARRASATEILSVLDAAGATLERSANLGELCARAASVFRTITGFDRVMVYRFLDDDAGVVVAEDRAPEFGTFMNHHFPASDIPKQARALYIRNRVRAIPDIGYEPAPLRPASAELAALDMSDVSSRSVSPIHVQYLRNMGVAASASVSIVKDGLLWGLIACHNTTPKELPYESRMACRALAGGLARQIRAKEEAESYRERIRLRSSEDNVVARLDGANDLKAFFGSAGEDLRRMLAADGFAAIEGRDLQTFGVCPGPADLRAIADWVRSRTAAVPFATHQLGAHFRAATGYPETASGLLATTMSTEVPTILMWFRAEKIEVVNWAGNPHKAVTATPGEILTPRSSFEAWGETVRGRAVPWTLAEIEAASRLKTVMLAARQHRYIRELNRELTSSIAEKDSLLQQKDYLLKEVNHRVQNSLQLVSAFLGLQSRAAKNEELSGLISEAQRRLSAVALVHRRLYSDNRVDVVDLARYLDELCTEMRDSMGEEWSDKISLELAPILISTDKAVNVGLILTELVINANKYAYGGQPGPVSISLEQHRNRFMLIVADRGVGKSRTREGFGTRMLNAMVDRLAGTIEDSGNDPGLRVVVTAPIQDD